MEGPLWWVLADNSHQGKSSNLTGSFFFYLLILPVTKRWRSDGHLLVQKGTKNRAKPPNEVTVPQGISWIVRGPVGLISQFFFNSSFQLSLVVVSLFFFFH